MKSLTSEFKRMILSNHSNRREFVLTQLDRMSDTLMGVDGTTKCSLTSWRTGPGTKILFHLMNTYSIMTDRAVSLCFSCALGDPVEMQALGNMSRSPTQH